MPPKLTFFCELAAEPLKALFEDGRVIEQLQGLNASVSLAIRDFSEERAEVVRALKQAGIAVTAWLLLPEEQGYWFNLDNAPQAAAQYGRFKQWSAEEGLNWAAVGLDIEPDKRLIEQGLRDSWSIVTPLLSRAFTVRRYSAGREVYRRLIEQMRADGFTVESYQFPIIVDERRAGSRLLQRTLGLVDLPVDREVLMMYSSFFRPLGPGMLWSYGKRGANIAVGSTGGGVELPGEPAPLNWSELSQDMLLANRLNDQVYVFSLEGCVRQDFLRRLLAFDWTLPPDIPYGRAQTVDRYRKIGQGILWISAHIGQMLVVGIILWMLPKRNRRLRASD